MNRAEIVSRLRQHVASVDCAPFVWGKNDCTKWVAVWVEILLGVQAQTPEYDSEQSAHEIVKSHGSLSNLWDAYLGEAGITCEYDGFRPSLGDIAIYDHPRVGQIGVIVASEPRALFRTETGVSVITPRQYQKVWHIT
jgi:hypothetical protein